MSDKFVDLFGGKDFRIVAKKKFPRASVIKAEWLSAEEVTAFSQHANGQHEPQILIRKKGDVVEGIEFRCSCGQTAYVQLQYEKNAQETAKIFPNEKAN